MTRSAGNPPGAAAFSWPADLSGTAASAAQAFANPHGRAGNATVLHLDPHFGYHRMGMRWCSERVRAFLRRWCWYLLLGSALFGGGSNAPMALIAGLAGSLVLPLFEAASQPAWLLPVGLGYALIGALPVVLLRGMWWPRHWALAERSLPLDGRTLRRSDATLALWMMLPWQCLLLAGTVAWWRAAPSLQCGLATGAWALSAIGSLRLSVAWMHVVRSRSAAVAAPATGKPHRPRQRQASRRGPVVATHWFWACLLLPLWRGPANASGRAAAAAGLATMACGAGTWWPGLDPGWPLAALALSSLSATSLLRARSQLDFAALRDASRQLPLAARQWEGACIALALLPMLAGLLAALPGALHTAGLRPAVLCLYGVVLALGCAWEAASGADTPVQRTARWTVSLALAVALASEVAAT